MGARELRIERSAQRARRNHPAIADPAASVDDQDRKVLLQRGILKAVIHHDDAGAGRDRRARPIDAVARHEGRSVAGQQQRLVAHIGRAVPGRIDPQRTG
jgi:hypothetical protein